MSSESTAETTKNEDASVEETSTAPEKAAEEKPKEEASHPLPNLSAYVATLAPKLNESEIRTKIRVTPEGLFIDEDLLATCVSTYSEYAKESGIGELAEQKAKKRLLDGDSPAFKYLIDGKVCIPGFLAPAKFDKPQSMGIPFFRGSLFDTSDYIHPRDPLFERLQNISTELGSGGIKFKVVVGGRNYTLGMDSANAFARLAQNSRKLCAQVPNIERSARDSLRALEPVLKKARPMKRGLFIPDAYRKDKDVLFLRSDSMVLVVNKDGLICDAYGLRGKAFHAFITKEFDILKARSKKIGIFSFPRGKERILGSLQLDGDRHGLLPQAFKEFIDNAPRSKSLRNKLRQNYTAYDLLKLFATVYGKSQRVEDYHLPRHLIPSDPKPKRFRTGEGWIFFLTERNVITSCIDKNGPPPGADRGRRQNQKDSKHKGPRNKRSKPRSNSRQSDSRRSNPKQGSPKKNEASPKS